MRRAFNHLCIRNLRNHLAHEQFRSRSISPARLIRCVSTVLFFSVPPHHGGGYVFRRERKRFRAVHANFNLVPRPLITGDDDEGGTLSDDNSEINKTISLRVTLKSRLLRRRLPL